MSRHAGAWKLKQVIASVGATIALCGAAAVPAVVSHAGNASVAAAHLAGPSATQHFSTNLAPERNPPGGDENNWG